MKKLYSENFVAPFLCVLKPCKKVFSIKKSLAFAILFLFFAGISPSLSAQTGIQFSYSYFNLTRNNGGGTLEKGDTIEVHALAYISTGTTVTNHYYIDTIRTGTQYVAGTLRVITNEGFTFQSFTDIADNDAGVYEAAKTRLRVNLGASALKAQAGANLTQTTGGGTIKGGDAPAAGSGTLGIVSYQLLITANFDDIIQLGGNFYYTISKKTGSHHFKYPGIKVIKNQGLCTNFSSVSFSAESSFGIGNVQNRAMGIIAPGYTKVNISANAPDDNYYAIVNNTSANGINAKVFNAWDIIGDHTGAADPFAGNPPAAPGTEGGYMLLVNADYGTGEAYRDTIKNLCPNTYYEFSAWIRNICGACAGTDRGVRPNLTYTVNNVDYYTTGNIEYTNKWVKRGFIYQTGSSETSIVITIKNNASGGNGNDWVLDDITLATCYPNLIMNPNDTARACITGSKDDILALSDTVKSYFNNYVNYCWEKSVDDINWVSTGVCGTKIPVLVNGLYQYVVDTAFVPSIADSGTYYRLKVGTTFQNLSNMSCAVNGSQRVFLKVNGFGCKVVEAKLLNFGGTIVNNKTLLKWLSQNELNLKEYEVEKSGDGIHFTKVGVVSAINGLNENNYVFNDPEPFSNVVYYRLKLVDQEAANHKYSKIIVLFNKNAAFKISTINPFKNNLKMDLFVPEYGNVTINLCDVYGKIVSKKNLQLNKGNSTAELDDVNRLPPGMYILRAIYNGVIVQNKLVKTN